MYNLPYHKEHNPEVLMDFLQNYPFAFLIGSTTKGLPIATQIPLLVRKTDGNLFVRGHFMRNTDHHRAFAENPQALAVFTGPHSHVSATWYKNPQVGSTWNYMSIHCRGKLRFLEKHELATFMQDLTMQFENQQADSPNVFSNLPESYLSKVMKAIVGFEMRVESFDNVFKLSQDRDEESYSNIIAKLMLQGNDAKAIAEEMKKRKAKLFNH